MFEHKALGSLDDFFKAKTTPLAPKSPYPGTNTRWAIPVANAVDKITKRILESDILCTKIR